MLNISKIEEKLETDVVKMPDISLKTNLKIELH